MEKANFWRIRNLLYIAVSGLAISVAGAKISLAQTPDAQSYTDEQLAQAGWTAVQIAQLRSMSGSNTDTIKATVAENPTPAFFIYSSVFEGYRSFEYLPELGWKEANDNVGRIGGWRSYAKQVQKQRKAEATAQEKEKAEREKAAKARKEKSN